MQRRSPLSTHVLAAGLIASMAAVGSSQTELKLRASDGAAGDRFGTSLCIDDDAILVASNRAAYLFSSTGVELQRFDPIGVGPWEAFGKSVALSQDLVVVGSPIGAFFTNDVGAVYVFDRATGAQVRRFETDLDSRDNFGYAVAVNERWLVVGDPDTPPWSGNVHLYSSQTFARIEVIGPSGFPPMTGGVFGFGGQLALDGDRLVASSDVGQSGGAVTLLDLPSGPRRSRLSPSGDPYDLFGTSLAVQGNRVVVGAPWSPWAQPVPTRPGAVFVLDWSSLAVVSTLTPGGSTPGDRFGAHVALEAGTLFASGLQVGAESISLFDATSGAETPTVLRASDGAQGDEFGPVASLGGRHVVGAPGDDDLGADSGSAYVYTCSPGSMDCDCDGFADFQETDCNGDGIPDDCQYLGDCDDDGIHDLCQGASDCDGDGVADRCETDCDANGVPDDCTPGGDCNGDGVLDACQGFNDCNGDGIPNACETDLDGNGFPDECQEIAPYCVEVNCPCGNDAPGEGARGCRNSAGVGATLAATGTGSVSANDLSLTASSMPPGSSAILFVADVLGTASPIGDGTTCTGGTCYRYALSTVDVNGNLTFGAPVGSAPPTVMTTGLTRGFQLYYRDLGCGSLSCTPCGTGANLTNGIRVLLEP